ncbi:IPT/TIG domain-containing protein [Actinacidiphila sp. bgisy160]|uniref:IPT/TIG domain-containing protein n=1 Tax=Actinacidiphila sp. bgisy160 TaxID=3413796 RepID=UPI003D7380AD
MGIFKASDGSRVTKAAFPAVADNSDPLMVVSEDLTSTRRWDGDALPQGTMQMISLRAGTKLRQSKINELFPPATITSVSPATGGVAGGTVVTLKGTFLDGVTAVTFGGTAGTALTVVSDTEVRVTTPAKAASTVDIVVTDDGGTVTKTSAFVFA